MANTATTPLTRAMDIIDQLMDQRMSPSARSLLKLLSEEIIAAKMDEHKREKQTKAVA